VTCPDCPRKHWDESQRSRQIIGLVKQKEGPGHVGLREVPEPSAGPGQVKIRVAVAGVCGSDLHILRYDIKLNLRPPVVMGHEFSGVVEEVGEGVDGFKRGDRVSSETTFSSCGICRHCRDGNYNLCSEKELIGYVHDGCFAPYCVVPAERVHRLPENVSLEEGALCEPLACCTHAVLERTCVRSADTVVIAGAGSIGLLCAQVARARGAKVLLSGTDDDAERLRVAEGLGVERTINVMRENTKAIIDAETGGEGAEVFLECSGGAAAPGTGLALLRRGGHFCQVGLFGKPVELDFELVAYKELAVTGSIGSRRSSWEKGLELLAAGEVDVKALVSEPLQLREWEEAFRRFEAKEGLKVFLRTG